MNRRKTDKQDDFSDTIPRKPIMVRAARPTKEAVLKESARLIEWAEEHNYIVEIVRVSQQPLSMGNHVAEIKVYEKR